MFALDSLRIPIVGAPMAGGPSTPALAAAVSDAGGFGFLASAYLSVDATRAAIRATRELTTAPFGLNIFVPEQITDCADEIAAYRRALTPLATRLGVTLQDSITYTDDDFGAKVELAIAEAVPAVSFTFGCPDSAVIERLHAADVHVTITVTAPSDAALAVAAGADSLCVQGPLAGGHRSTFAIAATPPTQPLPQLLTSVRAATDLPLIAAGGVCGPHDVADLLAGGAAAVQVGTLLLRCPEAGTKPAHSAALADPKFASTVVTRAYSGRPARGLLNAFISEFDDAAPAVYPQVNTLTGGIRKAAAADPEVINLWAGKGFRSAREEPAAAVLARIFPHT